MADKEHRALTGASLHELKGVSTASNYEVPTAVSNATVWAKLDHNSLETTGNPFGAQLLHVRDNATLGTNGGGLTAATWNVRALDTSVTNEISGASLSNNRVRLPAGTYYAKIIAPGYNVGKHKIRLQNVTDDATLLISPGAYGTGTTMMSYAEHEGRFTLAAPKFVQLQHNCETTNATTGGGIASSLGTSETYSQVYIWKVR